MRAKAKQNVEGLRKASRKKSLLQSYHEFVSRIGAGFSAPPRRKPGAQPLYIDKKYSKKQDLESIKINLKIIEINIYIYIYDINI